MYSQGVAALTADESRAPRRVSGGVVDQPGSHSDIGAIEHLNLDADEICFAGAHSIGQIRVGDGDAGDRCRACPIGKGIDPRGHRQGGHIIARSDLDEESRRNRCHALGKHRAVVDRVIAIADDILKLIGAGLGTVMPVLDSPGIKVILREYRTLGERSAIEQYLAIGRCY